MAIVQMSDVDVEGLRLRLRLKLKLRMGEALSMKQGGGE